MTLKPKRDLFPVYLFSTLGLLIAATTILIGVGHPVWAIATCVGTIGVAVPCAGWLFGRMYVQADIVLQVIANGGTMRRRDLEEYPSPNDDWLLVGLARKGVITVRDDTIRLQKEKIGRILALFVKLRDDETRPR
jgi:hypothetical protein